MQDNSHWVFGYGSLIWRPGFASISQQRATMPGVHRRLCVYSYRHRGTEARPGLVFGLVHGGSCRGMAFEVPAGGWAEVHAYLSEREMDRGVYREETRPMALADGRRVTALVFLVDEKHPQFAGGSRWTSRCGWCAPASASRGRTRNMCSRRHGTSRHSGYAIAGSTRSSRRSRRRSGRWPVRRLRGPR